MDEILVNISSSIEEVNVVISEFRGRSAYQVWLDAGNNGTLDDFFFYIQQLGSGSFDTRYETQGRQILSGSVTNYIPVILSSSTQIQLDDIPNFTNTSSSIDYRLDNLETFSSSLNVTFATDVELTLTASAIENKINVTASLFNSFSSSINTTIKTKLDTDGVISGSSQVELNNVSGFTTYSASVSDTINQINISSQSANLRLNELEIESGSVRIRLNNLEIFSGSQNDKNITLSSYTQSIDLKLNGLDLYTGSNDTLNLTQNNRLDLLSTFSGSAISRLTSLELYTQSVDNNIENIIKAKLDDENVISGSSQLTSSYDLRYELQGRGILSGSVLNYIPVIVSQSSQIELEFVSGFSIYSQSVDSILNVIQQYTSSNNNRLIQIENTTASLNSSVFNLNSFTQSADLRLQSLETESGSVRVELGNYTSSTNDRLSNIENFTSSQNSLNTTFSTTGSNTFYGNQSINGDLIVSGDLTARNFYIDSSSVIYTSGSTKFGDTLDDTHQFTGSVSITGSIYLNGEVVGTGKLDETVFNSYTQSINTQQSEQNNRLNLLETESGSIRSGFNSFTQSINEEQSQQNNRLSSLETESGSIRSTVNAYTSSTDGRLNNIETTTSSLNSSVSNLNLFTQSTDLRIQSLEVESSSIRSTFNSYTSSTDILNNGQDNRLTSLETESGSIRIEFNSFTQSVNTEQNEQNDRLTLLETESGSIRSEFNSYTSSTDLRLENLESESGSIRAELNSYTSSADFRISDIENFTSSQSSLNQTFAVTGSNTFVGNQIFSGSIIFQDGSYIDNGWIHDYNTSQSLAWSNRQLYDENENTSINWGDRRLYNDTGNSTVLLWGGENPEFFGTSSWAISSSWAPTILPTGVISSSQQITDFGFLSSSITTGDITFDGIKIIGAGTGSGDGSGYSTMELVPDNSLYVNDQYIIVDPTSPGHIHLRAGGPIDQTLAQLIIGGEKANLTVRDQNNSYDLEHHVLINTTATDSSSYTWKFKNDGTLTFPDSTNQITAFTGIPQGTISSSNQITELGYVSSIYTESFATTASNTFYGNQTINGDLFVNGDLTVKDFYIDSASVIYTSGSTKFGDTLDDTHQFTGSVSITGSISLNGQPIGTGKLDETIFNLYTQSNDNRLTNLESFTSSIDTTIKNKLNFESVISGSSQLTSSYDQRYILSGSITETTWDNIANKPSGIVSGSSQLTSSYDERYELRGRNIVSGSSQVNFNQLSNISANIVSSSTDTQNVDMIISGGSISANLKGGVVSGSSQIDVTQTQNYLTLATTGSNTFNGNQIINGDLEVSIDTIILTGSMFVSGTIEVDGSITGSLSGTATSASYVEYQNVGNKPTLVSGSSQLTGSYDLRYVLSGSITQTTWDNIANKPSGIVSSSSQIDIYNTTNYTNFSSSLNNTNLSQSLRLDQLELFTQSIDTRVDNIEIETGSINLRLDSLQLESGSIRSTFNSFTASYNTGSFSGSFTGSFFGTSSYALTASYIDGGFY